MTSALLLVGLVNAHHDCDVVLGRGGYFPFQPRPFLSIYLQFPILQRFYERPSAFFRAFNAMQYAGVIEVIRRFPNHRQAHVRTHHASDGPTQVSNVHDLLCSPPSKKKLRRYIKLSTDDVDNLLISEFIHTLTFYFYEAEIFYLIPLYSPVDKHRIIRQRHRFSLWFRLLALLASLTVPRFDPLLHPLVVSL